MTAEAETPSFTYRLVGDVEPILDAPFVVKGLITANSLAVVYGESGAGKSHVGADIAAHVASGTPVFGQRTARGAVLYVCAEGSTMFYNRIAALRERGLLAAGAPLAVIPRAVRMDMETPDPRALIEAICRLGTETGETVQLVVLDTLARCIVGDENAAQDMGRFVQACDWIRAATTAAVLIVHHAGKDTSKGARGHSSLRAAVDTEILVEGRQNPRALTVTKQRDLAALDPVAFTLDPVELGQDGDGEPVVACVVNVTGAPTPVRPDVRGKSQRHLLAALRACEPDTIWTLGDMREVGRRAGLHRNSARLAAEWLTTSPGFLTPTVGGYRLAD